MSAKIYYTDCFTNKPFRGSPTVVYLDERLPDDNNMQLLAREMNCPVMAFICPLVNDQSTYSIRYFTPCTEIVACGHATLAAAFVAARHKGGDRIDILTVDGRTIETTVAKNRVEMIYPMYDMKTVLPETGLMKALGIDSHEETKICTELETLFIEVRNEMILRAVQPQFRELIKTNMPIKEVVITSRSESVSFDFILRSFCPWIGIDEDPVTGSVHSALAPYWNRKLNKEKLKAFQASERGGDIEVEVQENKVRLSGELVLLMTGELTS
jgi:PhzF family phenazine biosynthesis protein